MYLPYTVKNESETTLGQRKSSVCELLVSILSGAAKEKIRFHVSMSAFHAFGAINPPGGTIQY